MLLSCCIIISFILIFFTILLSLHYIILCRIPATFLRITLKAHFSLPIIRLLLTSPLIWYFLHKNIPIKFLLCMRDCISNLTTTIPSHQSCYLILFILHLCSFLHQIIIIIYTKILLFIIFFIVIFIYKQSLAVWWLLLLLLSFPCYITHKISRSFTEYPPFFTPWMYLLFILASATLAKYWILPFCQ